MAQPSQAILRLEAAISAPRETVPIDLLRELWRHDEVVLVCARPNDMEDQPDLPLRIRGALGNALEQDRFALGKARDPFDREHAHELLYDWRPPLVEGPDGKTELAVPSVLIASMLGDRIEIRLRLFGRAGIHAPKIAKALVAAVENGVSLRNHAIRVPLAPMSLDIERFEGAAQLWELAAGTAVVRLDTPLVIRSGGRIRLEPASLLRSAVRRAAALAPWMGVALGVDSKGLGEAIERVRAELAIHPEKWTRTSRRDPGREIPVAGYGGTVRLSGPLAPLLPYLQLARYGNLGGQCAMGFGAITLICYP